MILRLQKEIAGGLRVERPAERIVHASLRVIRRAAIARGALSGDDQGIVTFRIVKRGKNALARAKIFFSDTCNGNPVLWNHRLLNFAKIGDDTVRNKHRYYDAPDQRAYGYLMFANHFYT